MKPRPIIFSTPMVPLILADQKTQTRRIFKMPKGLQWYTKSMSGNDRFDGEHTGDVCDIDGSGWWSLDELACPYGQVGDQLWGRESWRIAAWTENGELMVEYRDGTFSKWLKDPTDVDGEKFNNIIMQCSDELDRKGIDTDKDGNYSREALQSLRWRSAMFMPRWASRILIEITDVRIERVQNISEEDAIAEGSYLVRCQCPQMQSKPRSIIEATFRQTYCHIHGNEYSHLWNLINGKKHPWESNPWVWVLQFKRVEMPA